MVVYAPDGLDLGELGDLGLAEGLDDVAQVGLLGVGEGGEADQGLIVPGRRRCVLPGPCADGVPRLPLAGALPACACRPVPVGRPAAGAVVCRADRVAGLPWPASAYQVATVARNSRQKTTSMIPMVPGRSGW